MKQLLAKIRGAKAKQKCRLVAEVYERLVPAVVDLSDRLDQSVAESKANVMELNIPAWDTELDQLDELLDALESLMLGLDSTEVKRLKSNLEKDYDECLELGRFYEWLNPDGKSYTADYAEFAGQRFELPTKEEIFAALTLQKLKLYKQMEREGLEPKLQITPLAFNIRTLGEKIDAKSSELKINKKKTYVWDGIKDEELQYEPSSIKASKDGKQIEIIGGIPKSQFINGHRGFLVDIVSMKQALDADESIQNDAKGEVNYTAIQAEKYLEKQTTAGQKTMCYESYLSAQMRALKNNTPLETSTCTMLLGSSLRNGQAVARGDWHADRVRLSRLDAGTQYDFLRLRVSVRIL